MHTEAARDWMEVKVNRGFLSNNLTNPSTEFWTISVLCLRVFGIRFLTDAESSFAAREGGGRITAVLRRTESIRDFAVPTKVKRLTQNAEFIPQQNTLIHETCQFRNSKVQIFKSTKFKVQNSKLQFPIRSFCEL